MTFSLSPLVFSMQRNYGAQPVLILSEPRHEKILDLNQALHNPAIIFA